MAWSTPLPKMIGIANRNEKRAASSGRNDRPSPATIVMPDRDTPGIRATAWANPTETASTVPTSASSRCGRLRRNTSEAMRTLPVATRAYATNWGSSLSLSKTPSRVSPTRTAGTVATANIHTVRAAAGSERKRLSRRRSERKYHTTAARVPRCRTALVARVGGSISRRAGTSTRWPLEEIGRNSVRPCTRPHRAAVHTGRA